MRCELDSCQLNAIFCTNTDFQKYLLHTSSNITITITIIMAIASNRQTKCTDILVNAQSATASKNTTTNMRCMEWMKCFVFNTTKLFCRFVCVFLYAGTSVSLCFNLTERLDRLVSTQLTRVRPRAHVLVLTCRFQFLRSLLLVVFFAWFSIFTRSVYSYMDSKYHAKRQAYVNVCRE